MPKNMSIILLLVNRVRITISTLARVTGTVTLAVDGPATGAAACSTTNGCRFLKRDLKMSF